MATTEVGKAAESAVCLHLGRDGFQILAKNWRTKVCEIDIIARKKQIIYFIEVKFRGNESQGDGFSYITPTKLKRMRFAAQIWVQSENWDGDYQLMAAAVDGANGEVEIIEID